MRTNGKVYVIAAAFSAAMVLPVSHTYGAASVHGRPEPRIVQAVGTDASGDVMLADDIIWDDTPPATGTSLS